ncbi:glycosyltransferase family 2 protein [Streptomyces sp. NPDC002055]|uniref:glycosyltransferase family 2 protein n=1 Tax=Streptomyces sp. NPDC002055 TaxID=3154534 RepID=UPI00331EBF39
MAAKTAPIPTAAQVSVIVIGYNDAAHIADAVLSALRQGAGVAEVVAVDDGSTDDTARVLAGLARRYRRVRVVRRRGNSGGCGTPRNDGLRRATARYVMFLDSDDVLLPGAVDALLAAAARHHAPVVAGACVRRELPGHREVRWQQSLFRAEAVHGSPAERPRLVRDTLCVNKLYARAFLQGHGITFPEGAFRYEDFVFTARVLAAAPRIAIVPDAVYGWQVRRSAERPSISLDRNGPDNWRSRLAAHRRSVEIFEEAGQKGLAHAARVKFLDYDLRMYLRELGGHSAAHRAAWWQLTRAYLAGFDAADLTAARAPARWIARVLLAAEHPRDLRRLIELADRPARLLPPYARVDGRPVWAVDLPGVLLDGIDTKPLRRLPVTVEAEPVVDARTRLLRIRVHEIYGRLATAGPRTVDIELRHREDGAIGLTRDAVLTPETGRDRGADLGPEGGWDRGTGLGPEDGSAPGEGTSSWSAEVLLDLDALAARTRGSPPDVWDLRVRLRCDDGSSPATGVRAAGPGLRRTAVPSRGHGLLLVQPYATTGGSLALRIAPGPRAAVAVVTRKLRRAARRR